MTAREHPLRRRRWGELALPIALAIAACALLCRSGPRSRSNQGPVEDSREAPAERQAQDGPESLAEDPAAGSAGRVALDPETPELEPAELAEPSPEPEPSEVVVSGWVVDESGAPVNDVLVTVSGTRATRIGWVSKTQAQRDGSFRSWGPTDLGQLGLRTDAPGYARRTLGGIEKGTSGIRIVLEHAACFERLALEERTPGVVLGWRGLLVGPEGTHSIYPHFESCDLPQGEYSFEIRTDGGELLDRVEGILLHPGENPLDPRLDPLDPRGRVALLNARLQSSDGRPIESVVRVTVESVGSFDWGSSEGHILLVFPRGHSVELEPECFHPERCALSPDEQVLTFSPR